MHLSFTHLIGYQRAAARGDHCPDCKGNGEKGTCNADGRQSIRPQQIGDEKLIYDAVNIHKDVGQDRRQGVFEQ